MLVAALLVAVPMVVHGLHKPFWRFYLLHFASGVAILAGWGMGEMWRRLGRELREPAASITPVCFVRLLMGSAALLAGWMTWDLSHAVEYVHRIEGNPRRTDSLLLRTLRVVAPKVHYGYTQVPALLAQVNCLAIPELTILPRKRFWSGSITEARIREIVGEQQPDLLLLRVEGEASDPAWQEILAASYTHVLTDRGLALYLHKRIEVRPAHSQLEYLRALGQ